LLILLRTFVLIFVITALVARYCTFKIIVFSYSAIQPQVCQCRYLLCVWSRCDRTFPSGI